MRRITHYAIYTLLACWMNTLFAAPVPTIAPDPRPTSTLLYAQVGSRATLQPMSDKAHWYRLTLHDINDNTLWFTSRPLRQTGSITIEHFVSRWKTQQIDRFAKENVNATLVSFFVMDGKREQHSMALRLTHPNYNLSEKTLTYQVLFSPRENQQLLAEQPFYDAALFIDNLSFST